MLKGCWVFLSPPQTAASHLLEGFLLCARQEVGYGCRFSTSHFPQRRRHSCSLGQKPSPRWWGISWRWGLVIGFSHHGVRMGEGGGGWREERGGEAAACLRLKRAAEDMHSFSAHGGCWMNNLWVISMRALCNSSLDQGHRELCCIEEWKYLWFRMNEAQTPPPPSFLLLNLSFQRLPTTFTHHLNPPPARVISSHLHLHPAINTPVWHLPNNPPPRTRPPLPQSLSSPSSTSTRRDPASPRITLGNQKPAIFLFCRCCKPSPSLKG